MAPPATALRAIHPRWVGSPAPDLRAGPEFGAVPARIRSDPRSRAPEAHTLVGMTAAHQTPPCMSVGNSRHPPPLTPQLSHQSHPSRRSLVAGQSCGLDVDPVD